MIRQTLLWSVLALVAAGCAGFKPVERGDWRRVYKKEVTQRTSTSPQEIITRDDWEKEQAEGVPRTWEPPPGYEAPFLQKSPKLGLAVGEVLELRVNEGKTVELLLNGGAVELYWNEQRKVDGWKDGIDVTTRESTLFLVGRKAGSAVLRLVDNGVPTDIPVTVTQ